MSLLAIPLSGCSRLASEGTATILHQGLPPIQREYSWVPGPPPAVLWAKLDARGDIRLLVGSVRIESESGTVETIPIEAPYRWPGGAQKIFAKQWSGRGGHRTGHLHLAHLPVEVTAGVRH